jgi:biotin carboxyl carrier protein
MVKDKKLKKFKDKKDGEAEQPKKTRYKSLPLHGIKYKTHLTKKFENRIKWESPDPNRIMSFIPGTVKDVFIEAGQDVKEGDPMLILTAMKMDNIINIPYDGTVKAVHVKAGDKISKGFVMMEYA